MNDICNNSVDGARANLDTQVERTLDSQDPNIIQFKELWNKIWDNKVVIVIVTGVFAISSIFITLSLPDEYKSQILLAPTSANEQGGGGKLGSLAKRFGGLANLAGINLGTNGVDKTALALKTLESRAFIMDFVKRRDLLIPLIATTSWDRVKDILIIDPDMYDEKNKLWIRKVKPPYQKTPSDLEAYEAFKNRLSISQDKKTGFVDVTFEFYSPKTAQDWLSWLIFDLNEAVRTDEIIEAQRSIAFLNEQVQMTTVSDMQTVFYELIEEQTKTMMLANVRKEYVLKTVDPAFMPELKSNPKRVLLVILGTMLGGFLSLFFVIMRPSSKRDQNA